MGNPTANLVPKVSPRYKGVKMTFSFSCQYIHGVVRWLLGQHDTLSCALMSHTHFVMLQRPYMLCIDTSKNSVMGFCRTNFFLIHTTHSVFITVTVTLLVYIVINEGFDCGI